MSDVIYRQDAIDACKHAWAKGLEPSQYIEILPSAEPAQDREFIKLTVRNSNGRPYYSIIYLEFDDNGVGHDIAGYSSYSLDVISDYLKRYFGFAKSAESERKTGKWIPHKSIFGGLGQKVYTCDQCGYNIGFHTENFCPRCGSYNGGEQDD